jgi:adenylyltransferase/sulfurtransferase
MLEEIGTQGQEKLFDASVLVIGAGGMGSPLLYCLAGAGVGTIGIADSDIVSVSNLNRQYLHFERDIGTLKVHSAAKKLKEFNSHINIISHETAINTENAYEIISQYDVVALAVDNTQTRMIVNKACVELGKPFTDGAVNGFVGTSIFVNPGLTPCLACLYGTNIPPEDNLGAVASIVGTISTIQGTTIMQYILGLDMPLAGKLFYYDGLRASTEKLKLKFNKTCPICSQKVKSKKKETKVTV